MTRTTPEDMGSQRTPTLRPRTPSTQYSGRVSKEQDPAGRGARRSAPRDGREKAETTSDTDELCPVQLRVAGAITALEGAIAVIFAVVLVIRAAAGHHEAAISGYGTAAWFGIIFGGVLVGGIALMRGRRWGRAISLVAQILLLPVAYYLFTSHQVGFAIPLAIAAVVTLVLLFHPASVRWISGDLDASE